MYMLKTEGVLRKWFYSYAYLGQLFNKGTGYVYSLFLIFISALSKTSSLIIVKQSPDGPKFF